VNPAFSSPRRPGAPWSARACVALMVLAGALMLSPEPGYAQDETRDETQDETREDVFEDVAREAEAPSGASGTSAAPAQVRQSEGQRGAGVAAREAIESRADAVEVEEIGALVRRPTGWVIVPSGAGAVATFRATADREAQLEVRISGDILVARSERYAQSFQNQIQAAGFRVEAAERDTSFVGRVGDLITYGVEADGEAYRLVTWLHHSDERMWVFSLFCLEERLEAYMDVFEEMITELRWGTEASGDGASGG